MNVRPSATSSTRVRAMILALLAAFVTVLAGGLPATAATGAPAPASRFWGYYQLAGGQWAFATIGPDAATPADGAVEGWRYAVASMEAPRYPRARLTFEQICAQTPAGEGSKRVGVLVDYGRPADNADGTAAPQARAACAVVPADASGSDVLAAVADHRMEGGILCGLDGYPASGCFEEVANPADEAAAADEPVQPVIAGAPGAPTPPAGTDHSATGTEDAQAPGQSGVVGAATWVIVGVLIVLAVVAALLLTLLRRRRQT